MRPKIGVPVALLTTACAVAPPAHAAPRTDRVERAVVARVNGLRAAAGLHRLKLDHELARAADEHSHDMVARDFFAHESSDGTPFARRIKAFTAKRETAETLAYLGVRERRQAKRVVALWMGSPGHRAALMTPAFRRIGVAKRRGIIAGERAAVFTADLSTRR